MTAPCAHQVSTRAGDCSGKTAAVSPALHRAGIRLDEPGTWQGDDGDEEGDDDEEDEEAESEANGPATGSGPDSEADSAED